MQLIRTTSRWLDRQIGSPRFALGLRNLLRLLERSEEAPAGFQILVLRLDEIGDMILMSGFFRELRRLYPGATITLVTSPAVRNLYEHCPYIDRLLTYDVPPPRSFMRIRSLFLAWRYARSQFWPLRLDLAIMPRFDADYGWGWALMAFSRARRTVAYSEQTSEAKKQVNHGLDRVFTDIVPSAGPAKHEVERNYDVLRYLGGTIQEAHLELWLDQDDRNVAATRIDGDDRVTAGKAIDPLAIVGERMHRERRIVASLPAPSPARRAVRLAE